MALIHHFPRESLATAPNAESPPPSAADAHTRVGTSRTPWTPYLNEDFSPPLTQKLVETITNAALAAVNQHLANTGLLPQTTLDLQPQACPLARTVPDPSALVQTSNPALAPHSLHYIDNDARYLPNDRLPHSSSTPSSLGFDRVFTAKMQTKFRMLDERRVPRAQPLQCSPHTDRTAGT